MAGARLPIDIQVDDAEVRAGLRRLRSALGDLSAVMGDIGEKLRSNTQDRWGAGPDGQAWAALSAATRARKRRNVDKVLVESGDLRELLRWQADDASVRMGTDRIYGAVHQFGASKGAFGRTRRGAPIPWGDIPARPYLGLSATDRTDVLRVLAEQLARATGGGPG